MKKPNFVVGNNVKNYTVGSCNKVIRRLHKCNHSEKKFSFEPISAFRLVS
jgi:hypothetical protein